MQHVKISALSLTRICLYFPSSEKRPLPDHHIMSGDLAKFAACGLRRIGLMYNRFNGIYYDSLRGLVTWAHSLDSNQSSQKALG